MINQKGVITVELYNKEFNRYSKSEYVIISRNEYNSVTKQFLACKIVYSKNVKPYIVPIKVSGLRRNSKVDTLDIYTLKQRSNSDPTHILIGEITYKDFLMTAQVASLTSNFPLADESCFLHENRVIQGL